MSDSLSPQQRHANMAAIHGKDTKPEMVVRRWLWGHGFRYRLNHPRLPGKPDIVMRKYRTCIFVNGCFWHGHGVAMPPVESGELRVLSVVIFRRQTASSGSARSGATGSATRRCSNSWLPWAGTASPSGNVSSSPTSASTP